ncbi:MAG: hypothetical protein AAF609_09020 [Cyanobacteria bacterium P01_C01_bin.120]
MSDLAETVVDPDVLTASSCIVRAEDSTGSFVLAGAKGLPQQPGNSEISRYPTGTVHTSAEITAKAAGQEPRDVYRLTDGRLVLSHECG